MLSFLLLIVLSACDNDDDNGRSFDESQGKFVRFFLQLDANNKPIEAPTIDLRSPSVAIYNKDRFQTLKIPVALTSTPLEEMVTVDYSATANNITNFEITPAQLSFQGSQLVDTLFVRFNEKWDASDDPSLTIELIESSNPEVRIGTPNTQIPNNFILINLEEVDLIYGLKGDQTRIDVTGNIGEEVVIDLNFPNGYPEQDLANFEPFTATQSNFDFEIERLPNPDESTISYVFRTLEDFAIDAQEYRTELQLNRLENSEFVGNTSLEIVRDALVDRDQSLNPAASFYDTADQFYRVYGAHWFDANDDGNCQWSDFNTFTQPVIVDANNPNAVLGSDNGTADPADDIYYHRFRVSFETLLENRTTNPFNLRRWFTNEGSNADTSPGLNIVPALEFFPDNDGTSSVSGQVIVINQTITIGTTVSNGSISEQIKISGNGTYREISPGLFEIILEFNATNTRLFGGTRTDFYRIYNFSNFNDPVPLSIDCKTPIDL
ncbi:hypothetical protein NMS_1810 [Nonlabens marinus S1-08]|uniref:Uncharacterized protein n=1 Tax=Nonlabens marinus S1-08 TaxID=1454201 RepID=W8VQQ1_9FLAO|nr:hypothetical protein NMS_1810 [Nonlabens marinus S1-08]